MQLGYQGEVVKGLAGQLSGQKIMELKEEMRKFQPARNRAQHVLASLSSQVPNNTRARPIAFNCRPNPTGAGALRCCPISLQNGMGNIILPKC